MKVLNFEAFMRCPVGTVFAKLDRQDILGVLSIKGFSHGTSDYSFAALAGDEVFERPDHRRSATEGGTYPAGWIGTLDGNRGMDGRDESDSMPANFNLFGRDGRRDPRASFVVYEPDDVRALIARLQVSLGEVAWCEGGCTRD